MMQIKNFRRTRSPLEPHLVSISREFTLKVSKAARTSGLRRRKKRVSCGYSDGSQIRKRRRSAAQQGPGRRVSPSFPCPLLGRKVPVCFRERQWLRPISGASAGCEDHDQSRDVTALAAGAGSHRPQPG